MGTLGGKLGCAVAVLIVAVASVPLLFAWAWSGAHCDPVPRCRREIEQQLGAMLVCLAALAGLAGYLFRSAVNGLAAKRDDKGASTGFVIAAITSALLVVVLVIALMSELLYAILT
jgi:F0F1-type ATP synthase membrane subunit c/vacuolar-type H+-ATPase subunit K